MRTPRTLSVLLAVVMVVALSACAGKNGLTGELVNDNGVVYPYGPGEGLRINVDGYKHAVGRSFRMKEGKWYIHYFFQEDERRVVMVGLLSSEEAMKTWVEDDAAIEAWKANFDGAEFDVLGVIKEGRVSIRYVGRTKLGKGVLIDVRGPTRVGFVDKSSLEDAKAYASKVLSVHVVPAD